MIRSKADYRVYLEADRKALGRKNVRFSFQKDAIWKFQTTLRTYEYYLNCRRSFVSKIIRRFIRYRFERQSRYIGVCIPPNVFGPGLSIAHPGTIVVNPAAVVGANCRIHACVNIGNRPGSGGLSPRIGNNVYIAPGAKLFGDIVIADGVVVGANAVVNKSFSEPDITIAGVPAKKISDKNSRDIRGVHVRRTGDFLRAVPAMSARALGDAGDRRVRATEVGDGESARN